MIRISPYSPPTRSSATPNRTRENIQAPKFTSIYANAMANINGDHYTAAFHYYPEHHPLSAFRTSLFREYESCHEIAQILRDKMPTAIHVLGCSDGSEVYSYAVMAKEILPNAFIKNPENLHITGIDRAHDLIALAETEHIVCTDFEKQYQNHLRTPLAGRRWEDTFELTDQRPENFSQLVANSPNSRLATIEQDSVARIRVGNKMHWYKVKKDGLPTINFETGSLENYVTKPASPHQRQVYVLANSWGYMMVRNSQNPGAMMTDVHNPVKKAQFLSVIEQIKENNQGKHVIIVVGEIERVVLNKILPEVLDLGMHPIPSSSGKLWQLSTD